MYRLLKQVRLDFFKEFATVAEKPSKHHIFCKLPVKPHILEDENGLSQFTIFPIVSVNSTLINMLCFFISHLLCVVGYKQLSNVSLSQHIRLSPTIYFLVQGDAVVLRGGNVYNIVSLLSARSINPVKAHCHSSS